MLQRTYLVSWKEFVQIFRDTRTLIVVVVLPIIMLLLYGYGINLDVKHLPLAVYDQDRTRVSRDLVSTFGNSEYFDVTARPGDLRELTRMLDEGRAKAALVIPVGFARDLADGHATAVQILVDGSDSTTASTAIGYASGMTQQFSNRTTVQALRRRGVAAANALPVDYRARYWYNPELKSTNFIIPGLIAMILMMLSALLTSMTVVRERERGTIEQLIVSPLRPLELMVGKLVPYVIIAFGDVVLVTLVGSTVFHVPMRGSPALLLALASIFLAAALGIGLLISTLAPNQQFAITLAVTASQLPTVLLSGFIFPISSMPPAVQAFTNLIPASHFIRIARGIFLKGVGLSVLWQPTLILLVFGSLMLGLSAARFRKKL